MSSLPNCQTAPQKKTEKVCHIMTRWTCLGPNIEFNTSWLWSLRGRERPDHCSVFRLRSGSLPDVKKPHGKTESLEPWEKTHQIQGFPRYIYYQHRERGHQLLWKPLRYLTGTAHSSAEVTSLDASCRYCDTKAAAASLLKPEVSSEVCTGARTKKMVHPMARVVSHGDLAVASNSSTFRD